MEQATIEQALLQQVRALTPAQQQADLDFAAFLRQKSPLPTPKARTALLGFTKMTHVGWPTILTLPCQI